MGWPYKSHEGEKNPYRIFVQKPIRGPIRTCDTDIKKTQRKMNFKDRCE